MDDDPAGPAPATPHYTRPQAAARRAQAARLMRHDFPAWTITVTAGGGWFEARRGGRTVMAVTAASLADMLDAENADRLASTRA